MLTQLFLQHKFGSLLIVVTILTCFVQTFSFSSHVNRATPTVHCQNGDLSNGRRKQYKPSIIRLFLENNNNDSNKKIQEHPMEEDNNDSSATTEINGHFRIPKERNDVILSRRKQLIGSASMIVSSLLLIHTDANDVANAYQKAYPLELNSNDSLNITRRKINELNQQQQQQREDDMYRFKTDNKIISSIVWGISLWWLSGSRSNPIATPLANIIYKSENEKWLQDRNNGWFAALPWEFLIILAFIYICFGYVADTIVVIFSNPSSSFDVSNNFNNIIPLLTSSSSLSFQLAFVSLIAAGTFEIGRIFAGEKQSTKYEAKRDEQLEKEFDYFAQKRLLIKKSNNKNNVHRNEVVAAFRRFYSRYRTTPNIEQSQLLIEQQLKQSNVEMFQEIILISDENDNKNDIVMSSTSSSNNNDNKKEQQDAIIAIDNVTDIEIQRLLRTWAKKNFNIDMTSAGFYSGIQINRDADVFTSS